jgi:hypothetical protein
MVDALARGDACNEVARGFRGTAASATSFPDRDWPAEHRSVGGVVEVTSFERAIRTPRKDLLAILPSDDAFGLKAMPARSICVEPTVPVAIGAAISATDGFRARLDEHDLVEAARRANVRRWQAPWPDYPHEA